MIEATKEKLADLLFRALRPLAHLLIESGLGHREFSDIAKRAYVEVATKHYGIRGRDTNISRVAVMTGLTRKEVKRIRDELTGSVEHAPIRQLPPSVVLQHWHSDPDYLSASGEPLVLNFSNQEPSFLSLVRKYAGDIPAGALRTELKTSGAVEEDSEGRLTVLRRTYRVIDADEQFVWALGRHVYASVENASHNYFVRRIPRRSSAPWPARVVDVSDIDESLLAEARKIVAREATLFTEKIDDALVELAESSDQSTAGSKAVMVGLVYIEHEETN